MITASRSPSPARRSFTSRVSPALARMIPPIRPAPGASGVAYRCGAAAAGSRRAGGCSLALGMISMSSAAQDRIPGGRAVGPGLRLIIPFVDVLHRVSLRIVTMPIQSQGIITRDNVSVDVSAVAYFKVVDAVRSVVAIENVNAAIDQIAQTTLRKVVGQHTLDQTLSETDKINLDIRKILDVSTAAWGVEVTLVELKDIQLPDSMKRAMARQAEAEREKRAKIINAEGESMAAAALGDASDTMMAHPLALQLRNLQSLVEIGVDKNTTVVFPAPLMSTIAELGSFLAHEQAAASQSTRTQAAAVSGPAINGAAPPGP